MLIIAVTAIMHLWGNHIYHWLADGIMDPTNLKGTKGAKYPYYDEIIAGKEAYLNAPFFIIRTIIYINNC